MFWLVKKRIHGDGPGFSGGHLEYGRSNWMCSKRIIRKTNINVAQLKPKLTVIQMIYLKKKINII